MLPNKRFQSIENREVVTVIGDNGVFYNLSNGANIKKDIFFAKFTEMIDTENFFQQQSAAGLSDLTEKLRTVDTSKVADIGGNIPPGVRVIQQAVSEQVAAPPEYREMLLRRFEQEQSHKDLSQYKVYENEDDSAADFERRSQQSQPPQRPRPQPPVYQDPYHQVDSSYAQSPVYQPEQQIMEGSEQNQQQSYLSPEEESFRFFKGFKRAYPIKLAVDFDERIAEPNFIRMMVTNMEGDIIKFYTKEIMNRIYNDPGFLENKIYDKLKSLVFEEEQVKPKKPRSPKPVVKKAASKKKEKVVSGNSPLTPSHGISGRIGE